MSRSMNNCHAARAPTIFHAFMMGLVLLAFPAHGGPTPEQAEKTEQEATDRLIRDVLARLREDYVGELDEAQLRLAAVDAMLDTLDARSQLLRPEKFRQVMNNIQSRREGVGLELERRNGVYRVVAPLDDSPAARAGIEPDDRVLAIDREPIGALSPADVAERLRGPAGSKIELLMQRSLRSPITLTLEREAIRKSTVASQMLEEGFLYLRIGFFAADTADDLVAEVERHKAGIPGGKLDGVILDLRNNPGGLVDSAVDVADLFLDQGLIVSAEGRKAEYDFRAEARPGDIISRSPIVVMINRGTASSAEIVAAALQDNQRAVLQGTNTFGKGSLQEFVPLGSGDALRLTVAHYRTPNGRRIEKQGIAPDLLVHDVRQSRTQISSNWSARLLPALMAGQRWIFEERRTMEEAAPAQLSPEADPLIRQALNTLKGRKMLSGFELGK